VSSRTAKAIQRNPVSKKQKQKQKQKQNKNKNKKKQKKKEKILASHCCGGAIFLSRYWENRGRRISVSLRPVWAT
jgi:hypothetical protein